MKRPGIILILIALVFAGCESSDIITLPHQEPKLVVNCLGFNNHTWKARISGSRDVLDLSQYPDISNATVKIYENGDFVETLVVDPFQGQIDRGILYSGSVSSPTPGNTYKITVEAPGYPMAQSEFRQPDLVPLATLDIKKLGPTSLPDIFPGANDYQVTITFDDPEQENYYEVLASFNAETGQSSSTGGQLGLRFIDPAYNENNETFWYETQAFDDKYINGKSTTLQFLMPMYPPSEQQQIEEYHFTVVLRNITKEYYDYLKTTSLQRKTANDPFAQPVIMSNNIVNGYGVFGGFTQSDKKLTLPNE